MNERSGLGCTKVWGQFNPRFSGSRFSTLFGCISTHPFISKLTEPKLVLIEIRFLKKYFQAYEQSAGKFPLNYIIPGFNHHLSELNLSIKREKAQNCSFKNNFILFLATSLVHICQKQKTTDKYDRIKPGLSGRCMAAR